jgi:hypothetical protein
MRKNLIGHRKNAFSRQPDEGQGAFERRRRQSHDDIAHGDIIRGLEVSRVSLRFFLK